MKKVFLSAIMVIAFSGASMANTIEDVSNESNLSIETNVSEEVVVTSCVDMMLDAYETVMEIRNNGIEDWTLLNNLLSNCPR